jgi:glutathione S-transferase
LQADHISRTLVPMFYRFLQAQDLDAQVGGAMESSRALEQLISLEHGEREIVAKGAPDRVCGTRMGN